MRRSIMVAAVLVLSGSSPEAAEATECVWPSSVGHALDAGSRPTDVIRGRVVGERTLSLAHGWTEVEWAVEVTSSRGVQLPSLVTIRSAGTARCGNPIRTGDEYYFFTHRDRGRLVAGLHDVVPMDATWERRLTAAFGRAHAASGERCARILRTNVSPEWRTVDRGVRMPRVGVTVMILAYSILAVLTLAGIGVALRHGDRRYGRS
ncbi:MAG: hypothetical protein AAF389_08090 [Gemmatimonadota bacterium]